MPDSGLVVPVPPRPPLVTWRDLAFLVVTMGLIGMILYVEHGVTNLNEQSRVRGLKNRAAICDFVKEFGGELPTPCRDKELAPYLDPRIQQGEGERRNTTRLLCTVLREVAPRHRDPQCTLILP